ncbi:hypothetical protein TOT_040000671 [Theileria orientalis strain Shintoku]|uniref:Uncharacterized protein n=1 Tax=Theileria orientalis strain Shintoku TaxID=869250 RepID=J4CE55_THEOR|nr:hypothetical protein TOT_040000671 [Theileria orientalis strain Shintoku]PVC53110.1 hypothetical protein MACL_00000289 [Theileria orientalis]BAM42302.1 hypothetical protein TOT_040000671 [Theileria orientalis strain Shintoku]|eukprot:XP_009692603.1 hypothetical protein TOT_040000671 [Theileria orientalis strain Shintoku]
MVFGGHKLPFCCQQILFYTLGAPSHTLTCFSSRTLFFRPGCLNDPCYLNDIVEPCCLNDIVEPCT